MMKFPVVTLAWVALASPVYASIPWKPDCAVALEEAKTSKKPVFILLTNGKSCPYCQELEKNVFAKGGTDAFFKNTVIPVKVDFAEAFETKPSSKQKSLADIRNAAHVPAEVENRPWPYAVILSPEGKVLYQGSLRGETTPAKFIAKYKKIVSGS